MSKKQNPFDGRQAVSVEEFRKDCKRWQLIIFNKKRANDPHFDWYLTINGKMRVRPGTPWKANSGKINSWVEPFVMLTESGEPDYIRPCIRFNPTLTVIPLRHEGNEVKIGITIERRPFASSNRSIWIVNLMAGLPRRHIKFDSAGNNTEAIHAAARRLVEQEMGYKLDDGYAMPIIDGPWFQVDATFLVQHHPSVIVFVGEPISDKEFTDGIRAVLWFTLDELLDSIGKGETVVPLPDGSTAVANFTGLLEFGPLLFALGEIKELQRRLLRNRTE